MDMNLQETHSPETPSPAARPKVLVADDHQLILDGLRAMLNSEFETLAVDSSRAFIEAVDSFRPDIAVLDVSMPDGDGFSTARAALERRPALPIVFLSMHSESGYIDEAAHVGARAYLSKRLPSERLITALRQVLEGATLLETDAEKPIEQNGSRSSRPELTARQREVLRLIALGSSAKDIANQLNISVRTAEFHRAAIMQRLGLHSTAQMTRYAMANDLG